MFVIKHGEDGQKQGVCRWKCSKYSSWIIKGYVCVVVHVACNMGTWVPKPNALNSPPQRTTPTSTPFMSHFRCFPQQLLHSVLVASFLYKQTRSLSFLFTQNWPMEIQSQPANLGVDHNAICSTLLHIGSRSSEALGGFRFPVDDFDMRGGGRGWMVHNTKQRKNEPRWLYNFNHMTMCKQFSHFSHNHFSGWCFHVWVYPYLEQNKRKPIGTTYKPWRLAQRGRHFGVFQSQWRSNGKWNSIVITHKQCDKPGGECVHPKVWYITNHFQTVKKWIWSCNGAVNMCRSILFQMKMYFQSTSIKSYRLLAAVLRLLLVFQDSLSRQLPHWPCAQPFYTKGVTLESLDLHVMICFIQSICIWLRNLKKNKSSSAIWRSILYPWFF